jgi:hypothetical protein
MIIGACLTIANIYYVSKSYKEDGFEMFSVAFGIVSGIITLSLLVFFSFTCWNWYSAEYQAKIINNPPPVVFTPPGGVVGAIPPEAAQGSKELLTDTPVDTWSEQEQSKLMK